MRRVASLVVLGLVLVSSCSNQGTTAPALGDPDVVAVPSVESGAANDLNGLSLAAVVEINQPVDATARVGDDAVYFVSRVGTIHRFFAGELSGEPVLDISELTEGDGERGLLGLAFSPDGSVAYINYTNLNGDTVVASLAVDTSGVFDRATLREIIVIEQPFRNHNAGDLVVEPNGMLLVPMGDGGSADDPLRVSLDDSSMLGKVLRVDPVRGSAVVLAKGLRNPWRVDLFNDRLWLADVGQNRWEEVSILDDVAARDGSEVVDFGWSAYEANDRFNDDQSSPTHTPPVFAYEHGESGCSVSGGAVAVGGALQGRYVFADYCSGRVWSMPADFTTADAGSAPRSTLHFDAVDSPVAIVRAHNDLYVLSLSGTIWRING